MAVPMKGDLANLFRRKEGGVGLVLQNVSNASDYLNIDLNGLFVKLYPCSANDYAIPMAYEQKYLYLSQIKQGIKDREHKKLFDEVCSYTDSHFCLYDKKLKKRVLKRFPINESFTKVKWIKPPSEYSSDSVSQWAQKEMWYPSDWLKKIK